MRAGIFVGTLFIFGTVADGIAAAELDSSQPGIDDDGTVHLPAFSVPYSSLASDGAKKNFISVTTGAGRSPPGSDIKTVRKVLDDERMRPGVERLRAIFPVTITPETIGGIQTDVIEPAAQPIGDPDFPENREAWNVIVNCFAKHLGKPSRE